MLTDNLDFPAHTAPIIFLTLAPFAILFAWETPIQCSAPFLQLHTEGTAENLG